MKNLLKVRTFLILLLTLTFLSCGRNYEKDAAYLEEAGEFMEDLYEDRSDASEEEEIEIIKKAIDYIDGSMDIYTFYIDDGEKEDIKEFVDALEDVGDDALDRIAERVDDDGDDALKSLRKMYKKAKKALKKDLEDLED